MKNIRGRGGEIKIMIKRVKGRSGEYIAYCSSELLGATYSVYFRDGVMGCVAFSEFVDMIKGRYEGAEVRVLVSDKEARFRSKAMLELLSGAGTGNSSRK